MYSQSTTRSSLGFCATMLIEALSARERKRGRTSRKQHSIISASLEPSHREGHLVGLLEPVSRHPICLPVSAMCEVAESVVNRSMTRSDMPFQGLSSLYGLSAQRARVSAAVDRKARLLFVEPPIGRTSYSRRMKRRVAGIY